MGVAGDLAALVAALDPDIAYVLAISAVPTEHLHRPLIFAVGDDTIVDETALPSTPGGARGAKRRNAPPTSPERPRDRVPLHCRAISA